MSEVEAAAAVEAMSMDDRAEVELEAGSVSGSMSAVDVLQPISGNAGVQIHLTLRRVSHICPGERAPCMPFEIVSDSVWVGPRPQVASIVCCDKFERGECVHGRLCECGWLQAPWPWIPYRPDGPYCAIVTCRIEICGSRRLGIAAGAMRTRPSCTVIAPPTTWK